jgi:hypothetical protein
MANICEFIGCEKYCEGNTKYCGTHNHQLRKQAREEAKLKKTYVIPKVSKKMGKQLKTYSEKKKEHLEKHPDCQIKILGVCSNNRETNSIHHSAKRGANLTNEETFLTACIPCHNYIEFVMSAKERREKGFLR